MPKESSSFFHQVNNDLTVNLAEVAAVTDVTEHYRQNPDNRFIAPLLAFGRTCRVTLLRYQNLMGHSEGGREFDITREEMTKLQDALNWYNKAFALKGAEEVQRSK